MSRKILLIDDDPNVIRLVEHHLNATGLETASAGTGGDALAYLETDTPDAIVLDLMLPDFSGTELLARFQKEHPSIPVVVLTAQSGLDQAVDCMRLGALDYVQKPFDRTRLTTSVRNACEQGLLQTRVETLTAELRKGEGFAAIVGDSKAIRDTIELLRRAAESDVAILLQGDSGTGKEVAARAIHAESARRSGPFIAINCGAIPEGLIESALFGHEKGAFTGAVGAKAGSFELADGGTIFLDEIGELRTDLQVRLLRVLQDHSIQRVGGTRERKVDLRVIAATNRDLKAEAAASNFREDLYYRLAVFPVVLPPLHERGDDVATLAELFITRFAAEHNKPITSLTPSAKRAMELYPWPGNVRELENVIERATILEDGPSLSLESLSDEVVAALAESEGEDLAGPGSGQAGGSAPSAAGAASGTDSARGGSAADGGPPSLDEIVPFEEVERRTILWALQATNWNVQEAAIRLRIGRATIYRKIERYGLKAGS